MAGRLTAGRNRTAGKISVENQFNAFAYRDPTALAFAVGPTTYLSGLNSIQYDTNPTQAGAAQQARLLAYSLAPNVNQLQMATFGGDGAPATPIVAAESGVSVFASDPPSLAIAGRGSLRLRNVTKQLNAGGVVRILRTSSPPSTYDQNNELYWAMEYVRQHPKTVTYSGYELLTTHTWNLAPSNQSKLIDFIPWTTTTSPGASDWYNEVIKDQGMNSLFILFEPNADVNLYEVTWCAQYHCRYDSTSQALTNMALPPPTKPLSVINAERKHEDSKDSWGSKIGAIVKSEVATVKTHAGGIASNLAGAAARNPQMVAKLAQMVMGRMGGPAMLAAMPKRRRLTQRGRRAARGQARRP